MIRIGLALMLMCATAFAAAPLFAQSAEDLEVFRSELLGYVTDIGKLPEPVRARFGAQDTSVAQAQQSIRALSATDLQSLKQQLDRVPYWRQMPYVVSAALQNGNQVPSPRELALSLAPAGTTFGPDIIRQPMLSMIHALQQIPAQMVHPDYQQRLAQVEQQIRNASPQDLLLLNSALSAHTAQWSQMLSHAQAEAAGGRVSSEALHMAPDQDCSGTSFPNNVICNLNNIIQDVVDFFQALPGYATSAFNSIKDLFTGAISAIPGSLSSLANEIGLNNIDWNSVAQTASQYARLPCPSNGTLIPGFGNVGEIRTAQNFAGTIGFAGNAIQDLTPSDVLTSADLQAITIVANFPVQWLSRCLQKSYDDNNSAAESAHQTLVTTNLDVTASSRATQTSENNAQLQTVNTTADVAKVEAKLDALGAASGRIEATTQRIITTENRLETTSVRLDTTATRVETKVDNLQLQQGQTSDNLTTLRDDWLRMYIELDLTRNGNTKISLFELPESFGGFLGLVQSIVQDTLQKRQAAGVNISSATRELNSAVQDIGFQNYKSAYDHLRHAYQDAVN